MISRCFMLRRARPPFRRTAWFRLYRSFGASEATIFSEARIAAEREISLGSQQQTERSLCRTATSRVLLWGLAQQLGITQRLPAWALLLEVMFPASLFIRHGQHADAADHPFVLSERNVDQRIARLQNASQRKRVTTARRDLYG